MSDGWCSSATKVRPAPWRRRPSRPPSVSDMTALRFSEIAEPRPTRDGLAAAYQAIGEALDRGDRAAAVAEWDRLRRRYDTWSALVHLRFAQDTTDEAAKADRDYADALSPEAADLEIALKRRLLDDPDRPGAVALVGEHAMRLWETDVTTFDPAIKPDLEEEARISARYTELLASAELEINGETVNLAGLGPYAEDPDRSVRHAGRTRPLALLCGERRGTLDALYDQLVKLRHGMAPQARLRHLHAARLPPVASGRLRPG